MPGTRKSATVSAIPNRPSSGSLRETGACPLHCARCRPCPPACRAVEPVRCPAGHDFERFFGRISSAPSEVECPTCGATATRRISGGAGLVFKGSGFYITDYGKDGKKDQKAAPAKSDAGGDAAKKGDAANAGSSIRSESATSWASSARPAATNSSTTRILLLGTGEIATLRAIGFPGIPVFCGTLFESLMLSLIGGFLGTLAAYLFFDGISTSTLGSSFTQIVFRFDMNADVIINGMTLAVVIGLVGGFFPALRAARRPVRSTTS